MSGSTASRQAEAGAAVFLPAERTLGSLAAAAAGCRGCSLYQRATQTVFGEGSREAALLLVGEQPGDREDLAGEPFVGPAGKLLRRALADAGIDAEAAYLTNAVKHFKWQFKGKRRIHQTPRASEVRACQAWLEAEIEALRPALTVALGATAVLSLLGPGARVTALRGQVVESERGPCLVTVHPSAVLRVQDDAQRRPAYEALLADLKVARQYIKSAASQDRQA